MHEAAEFRREAWSRALCIVMQISWPACLALRCLAAQIVAVVLQGLKQGWPKGLYQAQACSLVAPILLTQGLKTCTCAQFAERAG